MLNIFLKKNNALNTLTVSRS